jgi:hypothetical protein
LGRGTLKPVPPFQRGARGDSDLYRCTVAIGGGVNKT